MGKKIKPVEQSGRRFTPDQINVVIETVNLFGKLSRTELAKTVSEHLEWYTPAGTNKADAALKLLEKLEKQGLVTLPPIKELKKTKDREIEITSRTDPEPEIVGKLGDFDKITVEAVNDPDTKKLWMEYINRYHYLGYKRPFGFYMQYFIKLGDRHLGCVLFSGPARWMRPRDSWIGWTDSQRLQNQSYIINNNRFLILPWVKIKYLASHALARIEKQVCADYKRKWGYKPVLMETFVEPKLYNGTCYKASNWVYLGTTTGVGLARKGKEYQSSPKLIFMRPLTEHFRKYLCSKNLKGRIVG